MSKKIRIGALISGGGSNLQAIIDACEANKIDGEMVFVGSDNPAARGLERAGKHGIPTFLLLLPYLSKFCPAFKAKAPGVLIFRCGSQSPNN